MARLIIPATLAQLMYSCTIRDKKDLRASLRNISARYDATADTTTLVTTDTHRLAIATAQGKPIPAGVYAPSKPRTNDRFWELEETQGQFPIPNWQRIVPPSENQVHIARAWYPTVSAGGIITADGTQRLSVDLSFLQVLTDTKHDWWITQESGDLRRPYVATHDVKGRNSWEWCEWTVKVVIMPCDLPSESQW